MANTAEHTASLDTSKGQSMPWSSLLIVGTVAKRSCPVAEMEQELGVAACLQLCCLDDRCLCFQQGLTIVSRDKACSSGLDLYNYYTAVPVFAWSGESEVCSL